MSQLAGNQTTTTAPAAVIDQAISTEPQIQKNGSAVYLHQLTKRFGQNTVLKQCQLDIKAGEFIAIVGRSGCGKSTLLRLIANLDQATEGRVDVDSPEAWDAHTDIRVMFQEPRLLPWKSVLENVQLGLPKAKHAHAAALLATVGLEDKAKQWPSQLSGGQKQRVALARALVHQPSLLLLDEPLGALDALTRLEMQQLIENLWQQQGFTALLVTHDVGEAVQLADRIILLDEGHIAESFYVNLPRPRNKANPAFAQLEAKVLQRVLST
jgi:sulfonate transport system ATP-binding protein